MENALKRYRIKHQITVAEISTTEAYTEVLGLYQQAYSASGKLAPASTFAQVSALTHAKIFGFYHHRRLVATFLVRFPRFDTALEAVDLPLGHYPSHFPAKASTIEISRLCIAPDYRGTDLIKMLFEQVHRELVRSKRASIVIASEKKLLGKYLAIGFARTGYHFSKPGNESLLLEILISTQKRFGTYGAHVGPLRWNLYLGDITREMRSRGEAQLTLAAVLLRNVYGWFRPVALAYENHQVTRYARQRGVKK